MLYEACGEVSDQVNQAEQKNLGELHLAAQQKKRTYQPTDDDVKQKLVKSEVRVRVKVSSEEHFCSLKLEM